MANKNNIKNLKKKTKKQRGGGGLSTPSKLYPNTPPFSPKRKTQKQASPQLSPSKRRSTKQNSLSVITSKLKASAVPFKPKPKITIGTYNILFPGKVEKEFHPPNYVFKPSGSPVGFNYLPVPDPDKPNSDELHEEIYENSEERTQIMINNLLIADLDIVCLQEVSNVVYFGKNSSVYDNIISNKLLIEKYNFTELQIHPILRYSHGVMILYKKKFNLISDDSVSIQNATKTTDRNCSIVSLQYNTKKICVVSCHFYDSRDYKQDDKTIQMNSVLTKINKKECDLNIIAGDFNQDQYGDLNKKGDLIDPGGPRKPFGPKKASVFTPLSLDTENITQLYTFDDDLSPSEYTKNIDLKTPSTYNTTIIPKTNQYGVTRRIDWIFCNDKNGQVPNTISLHNFDFRASDHSLKAVSIYL